MIVDFFPMFVSTCTLTLSSPPWPLPVQAFLRTYSRGLQPPDTGTDDAQADCITRVAPLVALYADDPRLMHLTAAVTRVTQHAPLAVTWACAAAAVLEQLVLGSALSVAAAVEHTVQGLRTGGWPPHWL